MKRLIIILMLCAYTVGNNTTTTKTNVKQYDYYFNHPTKTEFIMCKYYNAKLEYESMIERNNEIIERNNKIIEMLEN